MNIINTANMAKVDLKLLNNICDSLKNVVLDLDLFGFKGIEIIPDSFLHSDSDGNTKNKLILLPINKTHSYLINEGRDVVKSTIYHELCHIDLANKLPKLHELHEKYIMSDDYIKCFTIMIYIEYVAHLKSSIFESKDTQLKYYSSINNKKWDFNDECDKILFIKHIPYILGRDINNEYINDISNVVLKQKLIEVKKELEILPTKNFIDDYSVLYDFEKLVQKYITND